MFSKKKDPSVGAEKALLRMESIMTATNIGLASENELLQQKRTFYNSSVEKFDEAIENLIYKTISLAAWVSEDVDNKRDLLLKESKNYCEKEIEELKKLFVNTANL